MTIHTLTRDRLQLVQTALALPSFVDTPLTHLLPSAGVDGTTPSSLQHLWEQTKNLTSDDVRALLSSMGPHPNLDPITSLMMKDFLLLAAGKDREQTDALVDGIDIPGRLPLVDLLLERTAVERPRLDDCVVLACQHMLGSTVTQFQYLNQLGVEWDNMYILGKPYSTNRAAMLKLESLGANVHPFSLSFPAGSDRGAPWYDTEMRSATETLIRELRSQLANRWPRRILVLDDGGGLIERVPQLLGGQATRVVGVEQTTGGINRLAKSKLAFPVVSIAKSKTKLGVEAEYIAKSIADEMAIRLKRISGRSALKDENVLLIGFGPVGSWVANVLTDMHDVEKLTVFDKENRMASVARAARFNVTYNLKQALQEATVVVGCTGERAFPETYDSYIAPNTILFSGSSGNVEFNGLINRQRNRWMQSNNALLRGLGETEFARIHDDYCGDSRDGFWIANGGFPVNFSGALDPIPAQEIQVTRCLMIAGAVQASEIHGSGGAGIVDFDDRYDHCILDAVTEVSRR